jgi:hypothetical protein
MKAPACSGSATTRTGTPRRGCTRLWSPVHQLASRSGDQVNCSAGGGRIRVQKQGRCSGAPPRACIEPSIYCEPGAVEPRVWKRGVGTSNRNRFWSITRSRRRVYPPFIPGASPSEPVAAPLNCPVDPSRVRNTRPGRLSGAPLDGGCPSLFWERAHYIGLERIGLSIPSKMGLFSTPGEWSAQSPTCRAYARSPFQPVAPPDQLSPNMRTSQNGQPVFRYETREFLLAAIHSTR